MAALQAAKQAFNSFKLSPWFNHCMQNIKVVSAEQGRVQCIIPIHEELLNMNGSLHGGFTATLIDNVTTAALAISKNPVIGVSVDLHISYLGKAKAGDTLSISAEVVRRGKTLGFTKATVINQDGNLVATGLHTKFLQ